MREIHGQNQVDRVKMTDLLFIIAAASFTLVSKKRFLINLHSHIDSLEDAQTLEYLQIMVISSVIYDHVDPRGVFQRESKIPVCRLFSHTPCR